MTPPAAPRLPAVLPETPREAVGEIVLQEVAVGDRRFQMLRPRQPHRLLDDPAIIRAFEADEYLPYWAELWPSSVLLGQALLEQTWPPGLEALELGCGLGLGGIVALSCGLRVTFSDHDATALHFAAENARLNGFQSFELLRFDWRNPPLLRYPLIFGSDLLYEDRNVEPILDVICNMLSENGLCLIVDPDRKPAQRFREALARGQNRGLEWSERMLRGNIADCAVRATLYRIRKRSQQQFSDPEFV